MARRRVTHSFIWWLLLLLVFACIEAIARVGRELAETKLKES